MDDELLYQLLRKNSIINILLYIYKTGKRGATVTQIKNHAVKSPGSISPYVDMLEELGFATSRRVHTNKPLDARVITLTEKGKKFVEYFNEFREKCKEI